MWSVTLGGSIAREVLQQQNELSYVILTVIQAMNLSFDTDASAHSLILRTHEMLMHVVLPDIYNARKHRMNNRHSFQNSMFLRMASINFVCAFCLSLSRLEFSSFFLLVALFLSA